MLLGIVGGGQLARMLALAAAPLGVQCRVLDPAADACAAAVAEQVRAGYDDAEGLRRLAEDADCVTFEFENVPAASLDYLDGDVTVFPPSHSLATSRDRFTEKTWFRNLDIATAAYRAVDTRGDLTAALAEIGLPAVLKTRTLGYDGKGQAVLRTDADIGPAWARLGGVDDKQKEAEEYARRLLGALNYVGVLALELFEAGGQLLANEFAPRVHNSGHWTLEGAEISQFENHVRAVLRPPLGTTAAVGHSAMVNFVGALPPRAAVLGLAGGHLHCYGKEPRPGRKVGHATLRTDDAVSLRAALPTLLALTECNVP